jgi:hypothetical protein
VNALIAAYLVYLAVAVAMTVVVGATLSKQGKVCLAEVFGSQIRLAQAVNHLIVLGFYLVSFGFIALTLGADAEIAGPAQVIEFLSVKIGVVALGLGALHLISISVFNRIRRRHREQTSGAGHPVASMAYPGTPASYVGALR